MKEQYIENIKQEYINICGKNTDQLNALFEVTHHTLRHMLTPLTGVKYELEQTLYRVRNQLEFFKRQSIFKKDTLARDIYSQEDIYRLASLVVGIDFVAMEVLRPEDLIDFIVRSTQEVMVTEITKG